ncbi:MAG: helix-hairpin-helix domain-containing protein [Anaerolineae bacterium]|nr:helix-hairpin-helix domain-containing protein [Anaerolineae bacterium]
MKLDASQVIQRLIFLLLGVALGAGALALMRGTRPAPIYIEPAPPTPTPLPWNVYVSGEVNAPGVYRATPGMIIEDAIRLAGGFTAQADVNRVNLAVRLFDGLQIFVPAVGETVTLPTPPPVAQGSGSASSMVSPNPAGDLASGGKINLNTATEAELVTLPGIGPATAQNIIAHRTQNGPFAAIEDIMQVSGIGTGRFNEIKEFITVGEP